MSTEPAKPPRDASTILLLRDGAAGEIEIFMMVRHYEIDFNSGALVFPGGSVDKGDQDIIANPALYSGGEGLDAAALSFRIAAIREKLLELGAHMAAPCPAAMVCPLTQPDWCHFAARVERTSLHRRLKGGDLGHEDEKFSYVAVTREPVELSGTRVLRHPRHHPGWIELELCTPAGTRHERVTKRDRDRFRAARKAGWGDRFSETE